MLRASSELATLSPGVALMIGSTDLVGYAVLAVGAVAAHFLGVALGFIVGGVLGFVVLIAWFSAAAHVEKDGLLCECENCLKRRRYGECARSKGARHEG